MIFEHCSYIIDIDGTVLHNEKAINNSVAFIEKLQNTHVDFILATNSISSKQKQMARLLKAGISVNEDQLYCPIDAINIYLQQQNITRCFCVASNDDIKQIQCTQNDIDPQIIVLLDFEKNNINYNDIQTIVDLAQKDIPIITASRSPFSLSGQTKKIDTGAFV